MRFVIRCRSLSFLVAAVALAAAGCDADDAGSGTLKVEIWGEDFIETGIPAGEFADGWGVVFDRFLVNVGGLAVAEEGRAPVIEEPGFRVFDLVAMDGPLTVVQAVVPAGAYVHASYAIAPATSASVAANAAPADLQRMVAGGLSVLVEGRATKDAQTVAFSWGFTTATTYDPCHSGGEVADGGVATVQVTIHGDHLFYDDAVSEEPSLRFADLALADADGDGTLTADEMSAYGILALDHYGVGSLDIDNLWEFVSHMTSTLGHIDGEGHCETR